MNLKKRLKSMALAGMTFMAGVGVYHMMQSDGEENTQPKIHHTTKITQKENFVLHAGVLMPLEGETNANYEARRIRLEKQENQLRSRMTKNYQKRLIDLQAKGGSDRLIESLEDRLEESQQKAHYISYYSPEGQERLKTFNTNVQSSNVRRGRTYDF